MQLNGYNYVSCLEELLGKVPLTYEQQPSVLVFWFLGKCMKSATISITALRGTLTHTTCHFHCSPLLHPSQYLQKSPNARAH